MNESITTKVQKNEDGQWMVVTNDGRDFGPYSTRAAARAAAVALARSLQAPEVADVTEEVTADAEAEGTQADALAQIVKAAKAGDIQARNAGIRTARDLKVTRARIAEAAGVSVNYLQHILKPQARPAKSGLTKFQEGYQEALADIAAVMANPNGGVVASVEAWISDNRLAAAADIFARAAAERASSIVGTLR